MPRPLPPVPVAPQDVPEQDVFQELVELAISEASAMDLHIAKAASYRRQASRPPQGPVVARPVPVAIPAPVATPVPGRPPKLTDAERAALIASGACLKCRKPGHVARMCPGDPARSIPPSPDYLAQASVAASTSVSPASAAPAPAAAPLAAPPAVTSFRYNTRSVTRAASQGQSHGRGGPAPASTRKVAAVVVAPDPAAGDSNTADVAALSLGIQPEFPAAMPEGASDDCRSPAAVIPGPSPPGEFPGLSSSNSPMPSPSSPQLGCCVKCPPSSAFDACPSLPQASLATVPENRPHRTASPQLACVSAEPAHAPSNPASPACQPSVAALEPAQPLAPAASGRVPLENLALFDLTFHDGGRPFAAVQLDGQVLKALIDTGSGANFISAADAERLRLNVRVLPRPVTARSPLAGELSITKAATGLLQLAAHAPARQATFYVCDQLPHAIVGSPSLLSSDGTFFLGYSTHVPSLTFLPKEHDDGLEDPDELPLASQGLAVAPRKPPAPEDPPFEHARPVALPVVPAPALSCDIDALTPERI